MTNRSYRRPTGTGLLGPLAQLVVGLAILAAITPLSFASLAGSIATGVASGFGAFPVSLLAIVVITAAIRLWHRWR